MENKISKFVTGFRNSHGTQHSLSVMLEKRKKDLEKEENMSAIFMDLSIAFDTTNHVLLLSFSYPKNRRQRVQVSNKFNRSKEVIAGFPQSSIEGPLLFSLFVIDIFLFICFGTLS